MNAGPQCSHYRHQSPPPREIIMLDNHGPVCRAQSFRDCPQLSCHSKSACLNELRCIVAHRVFKHCLRLSRSNVRQAHSSRVNLRSYPLFWPRCGAALRGWWHADACKILLNQGSRSVRIPVEGRGSGSPGDSMAAGQGGWPPPWTPAGDTDPWLQCKARGLAAPLDPRQQY